MKDTLQIILWLTLDIILGALLLGLTAMEIYCWVKYGGATIQDTPNWANWFMFRR